MHQAMCQEQEYKGKSYPHHSHKDYALNNRAEKDKSDIDEDKNTDSNRAVYENYKIEIDATKYVQNI